MQKKESNHSGNFIMQAGILAAAGIVVRIIGLLYRAPLTAIIGDEGNGYYSFAYNIYANILLISSYSIPSAISKIMSQKLALNEYRNAQRIFRCAIVYVTIVGGIASAFAISMLAGCGASGSDSAGNDTADTAADTQQEEAAASTQESSSEGASALNTEDEIGRAHV